MSINIKGISNFIFLSYIVFSFIELFFNREFLVGVLPLGMMGQNLSSSPFFLSIFFIGAIAYSILFVLQFVILVMSGYWGKLNRVTKGLIWSLLYLTLLLDGIHIYMGINNTSFNPPIISSIVYVLIAIALTIMVSLNFEKTDKFLIIVLLIPNYLAYGVLIGSWLVQLTRSSVYNIITLTSGELISYAIIVVGTVFTIYAILVKRIKLLYLLPAVVIGVPMFIVAWYNLVPGIAAGLGYTFPYILGFLGVRDWMPPVFFLVSLLALFSALALKKNDKPLAYTSLALFSGALIYDTISTTTYLLIPVIACLIGSFYLERETVSR